MRLDVDQTDSLTMPSDVSRPPLPDTDQEIRRLRWQCRRGMLELDHLLERFLDLGYGDLNASERLTFLLLLDAQDQTLSDWFMARVAPPDREMRALVRRIVEVARERDANSARSADAAGHPA
jgi:antitoxin CptB